MGARGDCTSAHARVTVLASVILRAVNLLRTVILKPSGGGAEDERRIRFPGEREDSRSFAPLRMTALKFASSRDDNMCGVLSPRSRPIVGQRQGQEDAEKEEAGDHHRSGEFLAGSLHVHEKEYDEGGLDGGDQERHHGVECAEVYKSGAYGNGRQRDQASA